MPFDRSLTACLACALLVCLQACSSTKVAPPEPDPVVEQRFREENAAKQAERDWIEHFDTVLLRLDRGLAEWATSRSKSENRKAEGRAVSLEKYLEHMATRFVTQLLSLLDRKEPPRRRAIAAATLGFARFRSLEKNPGKAEQMEADLIAPLHDALSDPDESVQINACLGLGVLAKTSTPLDRLTAMASSGDTPGPVRRAATWTLLQLQRAGAPDAAWLRRFLAIWPRILRGDPLAKDELLVMHALRGAGLLRDQTMLARVKPYFSHARPLVRQTALIAAARSRNRQAIPAVLSFLTDEEPNANVRLTARKALKALGNNRVDHGYDIKAWRKEFQLEETDATKRR
ncbi:MAG: hypothetical protein CMJ85_06000 [Planctomycetes bacterium]|nr:hypothetical protein [Planctomycetota bacterium]